MRCLQAVWASRSSSIQNFRIPGLVIKAPELANWNARFADSRRARYAWIRLAGRDRLEHTILDRCKAIARALSDIPWMIWSQLPSERDLNQLAR